MATRSKVKGNRLHGVDCTGRRRAANPTPQWVCALTSRSMAERVPREAIPTWRRSAISVTRDQSLSWPATTELKAKEMAEREGFGAAAARAAANRKTARAGHD